MSAFPFLRLPLELRDQIYSFYFNPADRIISPDVTEYRGGQYSFDFNICSVSKRVKTEAEDVFRRENVFVRIDTPWPQAAHFVANEGLLPIVAAGERADIFKHVTGIVQISAPLHEYAPAHKVVILLDDLHLFCQVWHYSALNHPNLNEHLRVDFILQDPYYPADPKPIPLQLQHKLLLPFGMVKSLYEVEVQGYDESVKNELERLMAIPNDPLHKCLEDCASLMEDGDRSLSAGHAEAALAFYFKAFRVMHIIVDGRVRRVLAETYFEQHISSGQFEGQVGTTVRYFLRISLVSRIVGAYLKLKNWEEAAFWGMRSINLMAQAMEPEFEDFLVEIVAASDVGLLYLRTGIALKKMEDVGSGELEAYRGDEMASSGGLFEMSLKYFKKGNEQRMREELVQHGVKVPDGMASGKGGSDVDSMAPMEPLPESEMPGLERLEPEARGSLEGYAPDAHSSTDVQPSTWSSPPYEPRPIKYTPQ